APPRYTCEDLQTRYSLPQSASVLQRASSQPPSVVHGSTSGRLPAASAAVAPSDRSSASDALRASRAMLPSSDGSFEGDMLAALPSESSCSLHAASATNVATINHRRFRMPRMRQSVLGFWSACTYHTAVAGKA